MFATVSATLPTTTLTALLTLDERLGGDGDLSTAIQTAVDSWLTQHATQDALCDTAHDCDGAPASQHRHACMPRETGTFVDASTSPVARALPQTGAARDAGIDLSTLRGYQWKSLFLPHGTLLRSAIHGDQQFAQVIGNHIMHEGQAVSPNQFVRLFSRSIRNAWRELSVRRPGDKRFQFAARLRYDLTHEHPAAALKGAAQARPTNAAPPCMAAGYAPYAGVVPTITAPLPAAPAPAPIPRHVQAGPEWNLPERRRMRLRLEDIAY